MNQLPVVIRTLEIDAIG